MLGNYFKENSKTIKKVSLALKGFIGAVATSMFVQGNAKIAFVLLFTGALLDFILDLLPPDDKGDNINNEGYQPLKNTRIKPPGALAILALIALIFLSGCKIIKPKEITTIKDSVAINYRNVDVPVKGAKVYQVINLDSLQRVWMDLQKSGDPTATNKQTVTDPKSKAELQVWIDKFGNLQASCESKDQTVQALVAELTKTREKLTEKQTIIKETPTWNWIVITALATLLLISLIFNLISFKSK